MAPGSGVQGVARTGDEQSRTADAKTTETTDVLNISAPHLKQCQHIALHRHEVIIRSQKQVDPPVTIFPERDPFDIVDIGLRAEIEEDFIGFGHFAVAPLEPSETKAETANQGKSAFCDIKITIRPEFSTGWLEGRIAQIMFRFPEIPVQDPDIRPTAGTLILCNRQS